MEKDYSTQWNISDLSKIVGMSEGNFSRIFQEATGKSPADYLIDIRIKRAMTFLSDLSLSITDISYKVGFTDSNYFTRMFRKIVGVNPAKYRKQLSSPSTGF